MQVNREEEREAINARQIGLLRDFRMQGLMAFFDSPFRSEGPGLRELGMIGGIGDGAHITADGMAALNVADSALRTKEPSRG